MSIRNIFKQRWLSLPDFLSEAELSQSFLWWADSGKRRDPAAAGARLLPGLRCGASRRGFPPAAEILVLSPAGDDVRSARRNEYAPEHDVRQGLWATTSDHSKSKTRIAHQNPIDDCRHQARADYGDHLSAGPKSTRSRGSAHARALRRVTPTRPPGIIPLLALLRRLCHLPARFFGALPPAHERRPFPDCDPCFISLQLLTILSPPTPCIPGVTLTVLAVILPRISVINPRALEKKYAIRRTDPAPSIRLERQRHLPQEVERSSPWPKVTRPKSTVALGRVIRLTFIGSSCSR